MEKIKRKNRGSDLAMTTEQREAIDRLNRFKTIQVLYGNTFAMHIEQLKTLQVNINTVLSLITEQEEKMENKDKQIDLIIDEFYKKAKISTRCYLQKSVEKCMKYKNCKDCIKQYFAGLVEKE